jgi:hypothetical protein
MMMCMIMNGDDMKQMSFEEYIPNLFRLPIAGVDSTDFITVSVVYIEPLYFIGGQVMILTLICAAACD